MLVLTRRRLKKNQLMQLLDRLGTASDAGVSVYLPCGLPLTEIEKTLGVVLNKELLTEVAREISHSTTGIALFWGEQHKYLVLPPFPTTEKLIAQGYDTERIRDLMAQDLTIALVMVRLGAYAVGVFHNEKLLSSKVGTGLVHGRHRQGGSSAHRFERHREKQMEYFFTRVCIHVREKLEPYLRQIDYLYYGGETFTIRSFRKQCQFLKKLDDRTLEILLNVPEPKQASLEAAIDDAWSSRVVQWKEK
jgi:peptide subunit release factor 1 (eRF1)